MAVKVPKLYNGMYIGNMTENQAELILATRQAQCISNLKKILYNFPYELVLRSIEEGKSIRQIIAEENIDYTEYCAELRDYQTVGTAFMYLSPRSVIADGCGLGKTAEIAGLINWLHYRKELTRFLIAVENSALGQTHAELIKFTGLNIVAIPSEAAKLRKVIERTDWRHIDGIVVKHSALKSDLFSQWISLNLDENGMCKLFNTFFLDESSVIKNSNTKMFRYTQNIANVCTRVHLMNATCFETSIVDIYNQMDMMNESLLPKMWRIENDFCTHTKKQYWTKVDGKATAKFARERSGYKNQKIFKDSLKLVYFGRSAADVGKDLPHEYKIFEVAPTREMQVAITEGKRYNEVLNCPSLIPDLGIEMNRKDVPKLDRLCDLVENEFSGRSIMIYCFHLEAQRAIARELEKIGRRPVVLDGSCKDEDRYKVQMAFNSGEYDVIITNIKRSLNLQRGEVCIFYSLETNVAKMEQIRGRIDRHTSDDIKTFVMLLYGGTPEYEFFENTVCKRAKDSRDLTIDTDTAADMFRQAMSQE